MSIFHMFSPSGEASSMKRDNPLYESQEIRMEMFADVSDEEDGTQFSSVCIVLHHDNIGNSLTINCNDRGFPLSNS